jgi:DNA repair exonuclease SbcCD ATPase subunit
MALKRKISKTEHGKLSAELQSEYVADGDGFKLDIDGDEDNGALVRAKQRETERRTKAETRIAELENELEELKEAGGKSSADVRELTKAHQKEIAELRKQNEAAIKDISDREGSLRSKVLNQHLDSEAMAIAQKISTKPGLILPHIRARIAGEWDEKGENIVTKFRDKDGKDTDAAKLSAEFVANAEFAPIIVASKASGGAGNKSLAPSSGGAATPQAQNLATMKPAELAAHLAAKKESAAAT